MQRDSKMRSPLHATVMTVTPALAQQWLDRNSKNRPVRKSRVAELAADMKAKRWMVNGETIIIAEDGDMIDGQHRCLACVESQTPFTTFVASGVSKESFATIDGGAKRTAGDVLGMDGVKYPHIVSGAARIVAAYRDKKYDRIDLQSNAATVEFVNANPSIKRAASMVGARATLNMYGSLSTVAAVMYFAMQIDSDMAKRFLDGLETGEGLSRGSPILVTRNFFINAKTGKKSISKRQRFALLIKCWNAFYEGRTFKVLKFGKDEEFPVISGWHGTIRLV